jgi:hypothetical protein
MTVLRELSLQPTNMHTELPRLCISTKSDLKYMLFISIGCLWTAATNVPIFINMESHGEMIIIGENWTLKNPVPLKLFTPQIPHGLIRAQTQASAASN